MRKIPSLIALILVAMFTLTMLSAHIEPFWWRLVVFFIIFFAGGMTVNGLARKYRKSSRDA